MPVVLVQLVIFMVEGNFLFFCGENCINLATQVSLIISPIGVIRGSSYGISLSEQRLDDHAACLLGGCGSDWPWSIYHCGSQFLLH